MERSNLMERYNASIYKSDDQESAYQKAREIWDKRFLDVQGHVSIWRRVALLCASALCITTVGLIVLGYLLKTKPTSIPYVIEIGRNGEATYVGDVGMQYSEYILSEQVKEYQIKRFISNIRARGKDPQIILEQWEDSLRMSSDIVQRYLYSIVEEKNPTIVKDVPRVNVGFDLFRRLSENTYYIAWTETSFSDSGVTSFISQYQATVEVFISVPETRQEIEKNPLSVYIAGYDQQELIEQ